MKLAKHSKSCIRIAIFSHELERMENLQISSSKYFFLMLWCGERKRKANMIEEIAWHHYCWQFMKHCCWVCIIGILTPLTRFYWSIQIIRHNGCSLVGNWGKFYFIHIRYITYKLLVNFLPSRYMWLHFGSINYEARFLQMWHTF